MAKRTFVIELECKVEIDDEVIAAVDDDWRKHLYPLHTPEEITQHVAFNLLVNGARLTQLDGWADKDDSMATVLRNSVNVVATEVSE